MSRWLKFWILPGGFFAVWFTLSYNDWNLGTRFFSRETHDTFLALYAAVLGVEVADLPGLFMKAMLVDIWIVVAIIAFAKRKAIRNWWARRRAAA